MRRLKVAGPDLDNVEIVQNRGKISSASLSNHFNSMSDDKHLGYSCDNHFIHLFSLLIEEPISSLMDPEIL